MIEHPLVIQFAVFAGVSAAVSWLYFLLTRDGTLVQTRLSELNDSSPSILKLDGSGAASSGLAGPSLPTAWQRLVSGLFSPKRSSLARQRLDFIRAGLYEPAYRSAFSGVRLTLMVSPSLVCLALFSFQQIDRSLLMLIASLTGCVGFILPACWLSWKIRRRQSNLRQSLPDFLDLIVVCLEGGMSFESALQRTTDEIQDAHPTLAGELVIVQREVALGRSVDDALQNMAQRTGLQVVKTLAINVRQARRLGICLADDLRTQAAVLRTKREQRAEELAQKAAVKILFPTLIFIFPTIFVVVVGPAAFQIRDTFAESPVDESAGRQPQPRPSQDR